MPKEIKGTVSKIVAELAKDKGIAKLNSEWNRVNREKLSLYFEKKGSDISLEDNPEFRSIKNVIVKSAALIAGQVQTDSYQEINITPMVKRITLAFCRMISQSYSRKLERLNSQIDSKLRNKIEQKKAAHGLKTDRSVQQDMDDEGYGIRM